MLLQSSGPLGDCVTDPADSGHAVLLDTPQGYSGVLPGPVALNLCFKLQDVSASVPVCVIYVPCLSLNVLRVL